MVRVVVVIVVMVTGVVMVVEGVIVAVLWFVMAALTIMVTLVHGGDGCVCGCVSGGVVNAYYGGDLHGDARNDFFPLIARMHR